MTTPLAKKCNLSLRQLADGDVGKYSGTCILRPPIQPEKYGLKLKAVLKCRDIYIANLYKSCVTDGQS